MSASAVVQVREGDDGLWVSATHGVNVSPGSTIYIRLASVTDVAQWALQVTGVDEVTGLAPTLTGVDPGTHVVTSPGDIVHFTMPSGAGVARALNFRSSVNGGGSGQTSNFGTYVLTNQSLRVAAVGERFEGDPDFGWAVTVNAVIRAWNGGGGGGGSFTAGGDLSGTNVYQRVIGIMGQPLLSSDDLYQEGLEIRGRVGDILQPTSSVGGRPSKAISLEPGAIAVLRYKSIILIQRSVFGDRYRTINLPDQGGLANVVDAFWGGGSGTIWATGSVYLSGSYTYYLWAIDYGPDVPTVTSYALGAPLTVNGVHYVVHLPNENKVLVTYYDGTTSSMRLAEFDIATETFTGLDFPSGFQPACYVGLNGAVFGGYTYQPGNPYGDYCAAIVRYQGGSFSYYNYQDSYGSINVANMYSHPGYPDCLLALTNKVAGESAGLLVIDVSNSFHVENSVELPSGTQALSVAAYDPPFFGTPSAWVMLYSFAGVHSFVQYSNAWLGGGTIEVARTIYAPYNAWPLGLLYNVSYLSTGGDIFACYRDALYLGSLSNEGILDQTKLPLGSVLGFGSMSNVGGYPVKTVLPEEQAAKQGNALVFRGNSLQYEPVSFIGEIRAWTGGTVPSGWVLCDGQALSRAVYSALHALYEAQSYPFGNGDGSTTFNVPNVTMQPTLAIDYILYTGVV